MKSLVYSCHYRTFTVLLIQFLVNKANILELFEHSKWLQLMYLVLLYDQLAYIFSILIIVFFSLFRYVHLIGVYGVCLLATYSKNQ